jgi:tetratricopeptide (TPR) repeat protein
MNTPFAAANQLRKNGQFAEALAIYEFHWADDALPRYEWDTWSYAFCLRKTARYSDLLDFCRKAYPSYPTFEPLNTLYAWAIYYTTVRAEGVKEVDLYKAAKGILRLTTQANVYAPYTLVVLKVLDVLGSKSKFLATQILEWVAYLDISLLDTTPSSFVDAKGKIIAIASKCEQVLSLRVKALHLDGQHEACLETVEKALEYLPKLHYGNEHWLRRYAALSHAALGDFQSAITMLKAILAQRKEWFLSADLATVLMQAERPSEALPYLHDAAMGFGDMEKKVKVYRALALAYTLLEKTDLALEHYELVALIRSDFGWAADEEVTLALAKAGIEVGRFGSSSAMFARLKKVWEAEKIFASPRLLGTITKILPNGKSGFVKAKYGNSYFFQMKNIRNTKGRVAAEGSEVSFVLEDAFDMKKQVVVKNAVQIVFNHS